MPHWLPVLVGGVGGLLLVLASFRALRRRRLVDDVPTSKVQGVFIGLVEVKGTAETERVLTSPLAGLACVHYAWSVEEHWSRTRTETVRDSKGRTRTRTRHESGWRRVGGGGDGPEFYLRDETGALRICPGGAEIEPVTVFNRTCGRSDPLYYGMGPSEAIAHSDHRRRFRETAIPLHAPLYVIGQARERQDLVAPEIAADERASLFLISTRDEAAVRASAGAHAWGLALFGAGVVGFGAWAGADALRFGQGPLATVLGALGAYGLCYAAGWTWAVYNSLVGLRQRVRQAASLVDIQLKRRHDLLPALVESVRGVATHERGVQEAVAAVRAQLEATPPGTPGPDFAGCRTAVGTLAERYPSLQADSHFLRLQHALADTEERVALARSYYNEIATFWNTRIERLPDTFLARLAGMRPASLLEAAGFERTPVAVHLAQDADGCAGGQVPDGAGNCSVVNRHLGKAEQP